MNHSENQKTGRGRGRGGARVAGAPLTRRTFVAGATVLAAGALLGGPLGCSAPGQDGATAQAAGDAADLVFKNGHVQTLVR